VGRPTNDPSPNETGASRIMDEDLDEDDVASRFIAIVAAVLLTASCASSTAPTQAVPAGAIRVTGSVSHYSIEGGFWAVRGDDGVTYDPMNGLSSEFQREGLRVELVAKVRHDLAGFHMAGPIVEIISIRAL
jgi:hypothetical protein